MIYENKEINKRDIVYDFIFKFSNNQTSQILFF